LTVVATALLGASCGFAGADQSADAATVCAQQNVRLPSDAVALSEGVMIPIVVDVTTEDLSDLPTSAGANPEAIAREAALAIYRARAGTIATAAGLPLARVANVQDKIVLHSERPDGAGWRFSGRLVLLVEEPEQVCALGDLPEVRQVAWAVDQVPPGDSTVPPPG
jgi:hypothetical protein